MPMQLAIFSLAVGLTCCGVSAAGTVSASFVVDTRVLRGDFDRDGLPDVYEQSVGLNWQLHDADDDLDGDGRSNIREYNAGSDPGWADWPGTSRRSSRVFAVNTGGLVISKDSDFDGMPDWWELRYGLDPKNYDGDADNDFDGQSNVAEYLAGRNPVAEERLTVALARSQFFEVDTGGKFRDTDGDGLPNWWERLFFANSTAAMGEIDSDGDGHSNRAEFLAGTNPNDGESVLSIIAVRAERDVSIIRWSSVPNRTYSLWRLDPETFVSEVIVSNVVASPPVNSYTNSVSGTRDFYRVSTGP
jgi:hypothetical protein